MMDFERPEVEIPVMGVEEGYVYADKTALIHRLVKTGSYYFLSRPRRFGKSLLISTLEAYFRGQKELFEGLAIEKLETEWKEYPILHYDLNAKKFDTVEDLYELVGRQLERYELPYATDSRTIIKVGVNFSKETRNIQKWIIR
jgi:hypothetical protein